MKAALEQHRAREENGRLEELAAALRSEMAASDFQKAAILEESDEKLRIAEARIAKLEAKEASERLLRQALAAELRQLREAHHRSTAPGSDTPTSERHDLSAEVGASTVQVLKAELQEAQPPTEPK